MRELVIAWNVKMLLTAQDKSQSALASFLGIQRPTMTNENERTYRMVGSRPSEVCRFSRDDH